jgi:hypothetical protein
MISSGRHPKKEIADALGWAEDEGLVVTEIHRGHRWGELACATCGSTFAIWSTPRSPGTHAKQINRFTDVHTKCESQLGGGRP